MRGRASGSRDSMIVRRLRPVTSSVDSFIVTPSMMSSNFTAPPTSDSSGMAKGSHSPSLELASTFWPSFTIRRAPYTMR